MVFADEPDSLAVVVIDESDWDGGIAVVIDVVQAFDAWDVNHDGTADTQDVLAIYDFIMSPDVLDATTVEDVNGDGTVDTQDVLMVYEKMAT